MNINELQEVQSIVSKTYTHEELHEALMFIQDLLERSMIDFFLLGDTAKAIVSTDLPKFNMDKIHIGVTKNHYNTPGKSILNTLLDEWHVPKVETERGLSLDYKGLPIEVDIIQNDYFFFSNPDVRFYTITEFRVPNPMNAYLSYLERFNDVK